MSKSKKRITLLSEFEIDELYASPVFNEAEKGLYFSFNHNELEIIKSFKTKNAQLQCMLNIGYFKAKQQLFKFDIGKYHSDLSYLKTKYFTENIQVKTLNYRTAKAQSRAILKLFNYHKYSENNKNITNQLTMLVRHYPKPHNAVRELMNYFDESRIVIPSYRKLQDLFTLVYSDENTRLANLLESLPSEVNQQLCDLICQDSDTLDLNDLRYDQENFTYNEVINEVEKVTELKALYQCCQTFLPSLKLSQNAVRYYSSIVEQYPVSKLRKLSESHQRLYALCFVYHRYQHFTDNLITSFMYHLRVIKNEAKDHANKAFYEHTTTVVQKYPNLATFFRWFPQQKDNPPSSHTNFYKSAYNILSEEEFNRFANYFEGKDFDIRSAK